MYYSCHNYPTRLRAVWKLFIYAHWLKLKLQEKSQFSFSNYSMLKLVQYPT